MTTARIKQVTHGQASHKDKFSKSVLLNIILYRSPNVQSTDQESFLYSAMSFQSSLSTST